MCSGIESGARSGSRSNTHPHIHTHTHTHTNERKMRSSVRTYARDLRLIITTYRVSRDGVRSLHLIYPQHILINTHRVFRDRARGEVRVKVKHTRACARAHPHTRAYT